MMMREQKDCFASNRIRNLISAGKMCVIKADIRIGFLVTTWTSLKLAVTDLQSFL